MKATLIGTASLIIIFLTACNLPTTPRRSAPFPELPRSTSHPTIDALSVPADFLTGITVVSYDPLNDLRNWNLHTDTGTLTEGIFVLSGAPRWQSSIWFKRQFTQGEGLLARFQVQNANARSEFVFVTGNWLTPTFRQYGIYNGASPKADLFQGLNDLGGYDIVSNLTLSPGAWYDLLLAVGTDGHLLTVIWDPQDSAHRAVYDFKGGPDWSGRSWVFLPKADQGETVFVDEFYEISFVDIK